jgi:hypothetical protein
LWLAEPKAHKTPTPDLLRPSASPQKSPQRLQQQQAVVQRQQQELVITEQRRQQQQAAGTPDALSASVASAKLAGSPSPDQSTSAPSSPRKSSDPADAVATRRHSTTPPSHTTNLLSLLQVVLSSCPRALCKRNREELEILAGATKKSQSQGQRLSYSSQQLYSRFEPAFETISFYW